jgi:hypothetical protein
VVHTEQGAVGVSEFDVKKKISDSCWVSVLGSCAVGPECWFVNPITYLHLKVIGLHLHAPVSWVQWLSCRVKEAEDWCLCSVAGVEDPSLSRHPSRRLLASSVGHTLPAERFPIVISVKGWVNPRAVTWLQEWSELQSFVALSPETACGKSGGQPVSTFWDALIGTTSFCFRYLRTLCVLRRFEAPNEMTTDILGASSLGLRDLAILERDGARKQN